MKFNCGLTTEQKFNAKQKWHPVFAWLPHRVGDGDCRWLEVIERRGKPYVEYTMYGATWKLRFEYRARIVPN